MVRCVGPTLAAHELHDCRERYLFNPELEESAEYYRVVANPIRLKVLHLLRERDELCVCDMKDIFDVTMPAMSQHLAKLKAHRLLRASKRGQTVFYRLSDHPFLRRLYGQAPHEAATPQDGRDGFGTEDSPGALT